jgi:co-chaperonin GroES (HSP10)
MHAHEFSGNNSPAISQQSNKFTIGSLSFEAFSDRLIIEEDAFQSGYECEVCSGHGNFVCLACTGTGIRGGKKCSDCDGRGKTTCTKCKGLGGLLITPQTAERRPTTGTVVSVGAGRYDQLSGKLIPMHFKVGEKVMFSNFAGHFIDLVRAGQPITLRILHEPEILAKMEGHLMLTNFKGKSEVTLNEK